MNPRVQQWRMGRMGRRAAAVLLLLSWLPASAEADPRWWQHDRALTGGPGAKSRPDVAFVAGNVGEGLFVVWQEATAPAASHVALVASFDGGCTWCGPVRWTDGVVRD